jgi:hypothetical protein
MGNSCHQIDTKVKQIKNSPCIGNVQNFVFAHDLIEIENFKSDENVIVSIDVGIQIQHQF